MSTAHCSFTDHWPSEERPVSIAVGDGLDNIGSTARANVQLESTRMLLEDGAGDARAVRGRNRHCLREEKTWNGWLTSHGSRQAHEGNGRS